MIKKGKKNFKKLTNLESTKSQKQIKLLIFRKSNNELNTIFQGIVYLYMLLIWGVTAVLKYIRGKI